MIPATSGSCQGRSHRSKTKKDEWPSAWDWKGSNGPLISPWQFPIFWTWMVSFILCVSPHSVFAEPLSPTKGIVGKIMTVPPKVRLRGAFGTLWQSNPPLDGPEPRPGISQKGRMQVVLGKAPRVTTPRLLLTWSFPENSCRAFQKLTSHFSPVWYTPFLQHWSCLCWRLFLKV